MTVHQIAGRVAPPPPSGPGAPAAAPTTGPAFADLLERASTPDRVSVSAHAAQRLDERAIDFSAPVRDRIAGALDALDAKGAREAVLFGDGAAFVVSVPNRTVVTALAPDEMRDRVVTQIDSAVLL
jgi:flagellar operon protein